MDLLNQDFLQPKKLLEIRWVASKQAAIRAIIRDYSGIVLDIGEAVTLAAEGDFLAELSKLSARFQREDYRVSDLHDTLEEFVKVLNSWEHNESPSITALKDKVPTWPSLLSGASKTIGIPVIV
ncbi:hypothetical protein RvY_10382 [Ramazzottius varieornatus]|uniref:Uncharacterized protein n=1 Tax=Ramazzottius varieornatus TaxID=947166 RepID=A0A1D1VCI8_RAMVA|nr:hypothetical protein RvY_10382 [Ramazzottius varieornatus]